MFVSSTSLLCLHVLISCLINIKRMMDKDNYSMWTAIENSPVSGILIMYTFVVCWFVGGLTAFHLYLIATNQVFYIFCHLFDFFFLLAKAIANFEYIFFSPHRQRMRISDINMIER